MDIKDFVKKFAAQFDDTDASEFKSETVFHELDEYSSLIALTIIGMVDDEYGVTIGAEEMSTAVTVEDLFNMVKAKM